MTLQEFKAWFDGFTEGFDGKVPNAKQWGRIKTRIKEIDGAPVTERIFVDRYWGQPWWGYHNPNYYPYYATNTGGMNVATMSAQKAINNEAFNPTLAMYALGKADASA